ncbi:hypothetical protein ACW5WN_07600 [Aeromonas lacus]|uniref:hypothetical protein n=1 Tax=Aeromonas lacus TaxID=558884 RepID=UPI00051C10DD|nr:hypothetical protein [Aeromonas lacus]
MQLLKRLFSTITEDALQSEINSLQERLNKAEEENEQLKADLAEHTDPEKRLEECRKMALSSPNYLVRKYLKETAAKNGAHFPKKPHIPVNRSCYPEGVQQIIGESNAWNNVVYLILWNLDLIHEDYVAALLSEINGKDYTPYYIKNITRGARYTSKAIYKHVMFKNNVR